MDRLDNRRRKTVAMTQMNYLIKYKFSRKKKHYYIDCYTVFIETSYNGKFVRWPCVTMRLRKTICKYIQKKTNN